VVTKERADEPDSKQEVEIHGRFDLALEREGGVVDLANYHRLLFLRGRAEEGRLTFHAEIVSSMFYEIGLAPWRGHRFRFGKVLVPFGEVRAHHRYGGASSLQRQGLLLPVIWAEYGLAYRPPAFALGIVDVQAELFGGKGVTSSPPRPLVLRGPDPGKRFAGSGRLALSAGSGAWCWISAYASSHRPGTWLTLCAADLLLDYSSIDLPLLRSLRWEAGYASAYVEQSSAGEESYRKHGDYYQVTRRVWRSGAALALRMGSYVDDSRNPSSADRRIWTLEARAPWRVGSHTLTALLQHQWRRERVAEADDDLTRLHLALDF